MKKLLALYALTLFGLASALADKMPRRAPKDTADAGTDAGFGIVSVSVYGCTDCSGFNYNPDSGWYDPK